MHAIGRLAMTQPWLLGWAPAKVQTSPQFASCAALAMQRHCRYACARDRRAQLRRRHRADVDRPFGCRLDSLKATFPLLQIDGLIVAARIEFRAPYFVHSLVLGPTVVNRRPKSQI
jgi:hypothetical protein